MTLGQLFSGITDIPQELTERVVSGVTSDNREVEPGVPVRVRKGQELRRPQRGGVNARKWRVRPL